MARATATLILELQDPSLFEATMESYVRELEAVCDACPCCTDEYTCDEHLPLMRSRQDDLFALGMGMLRLRVE